MHDVNDIEAHIPALRRYAFALTRDGDRADDLVQDCLERALSRWRLRPHGAALRAWLFTVLRNLYIDGYRQAQRRGRNESYDNDGAAFGHPTQESLMIAGDILSALDALPEEQKSLLLLVGVEDLSYADVARILGIPLGTVMSRLSRARERLRTAIDTDRLPQLRRVK